MYKWPEGRVIRIICFIVAAAVAADIALLGAWPEFTNYLNNHSDTASGSGGRTLARLLRGIFYAVVTVGVLGAAVVLVGFKARSVDFLIEVEGEMQKVEWPVKNLVRMTLLIAVIIVAMAGLIFLVNSLMFYILVSGIDSMKGYL